MDFLSYFVKTAYRFIMNAEDRASDSTVPRRFRATFSVRLLSRRPYENGPSGRWDSPFRLSSSESISIHAPR